MEARYLRFKIKNISKQPLIKRPINRNFKAYIYFNSFLALETESLNELSVFFFSSGGP